VGRSRPGKQRREASIFTADYGEAGALAVYGPTLGLPQAQSGHYTYRLWGPGDVPDRVVVAVAVAVGSVDQLRPHLAHCSHDATIHGPDNVDDDENGTAIRTCTGPRGSWSSFWSDLRHYG
jgi:hypothetical protein